MEELKPCPFCGQAPEIVSSGGMKPGAYVIRCVNEECPVNAYTIAAPLDDAVKTWNTRAERTCVNEFHGTNLLICSECHTYSNTEIYGEYQSPAKYCPCCGARVVE